MSFVSTLDQLNLADVLRRLETHGKTGQLVIKQGGLWVELYFRQGRLMCIGPVRANATLGDRLMQVGMISQAALQDIMHSIRGFEPSETRIAIAAMDLGYVSREDLRSWAVGEASKVIEVLLTWTTGEIYFEEDCQPPAERLLVSVALSSLLPVYPSVQPSTPPVAPQPPRVEQVPSLVQEPPNKVAPVPVTELPPQGPRPRITQSLVDTSAVAPFAPASSSLPGAAASLVMPTPVTTPIVPKSIDISFMKPDMVLIPTDLSAIREQDPALQMTPEQWRVFTRADGRTTLQAASQVLVMSPVQVCQIAGELVAAGLLHVASPGPSRVQEFSPLSRDFIAAGLANGHIMPGYAASPAQPWAANVPATGALNSYAPVTYVETESQWGNGGNGATFTVGRGWGMASQRMQAVQPAQSSGGMAQGPNNSYVSVGGGQRY